MICFSISQCRMFCLFRLLSFDHLSHCFLCLILSFFGVSKIRYFMRDNFIFLSGAPEVLGPFHQNSPDYFWWLGLGFQGQLNEQCLWVMHTTLQYWADLSGGPLACCPCVTEDLVQLTGSWFSGLCFFITFWPCGILLGWIWKFIFEMMGRWSVHQSALHHGLYHSHTFSLFFTLTMM